MKKIALVCSTVISSLLLTAPATAGFYAELSAGSAKNKAEANYTATYTTTYLGETQSETETETDSSPSEKSTSFGVRFGYQFNNYIAVELGHHQYGEWNENDVDEDGANSSAKIESSSISAGIKGILPLSDDLSLFARAGLAKWDFKATSTAGEFEPMKKDDNDIYYGIGAEYNVNESVSLGVEYSVLDMGWGESLSDAGTYEDFSYSTTGHYKTSYKVENISLLLKVSF
ncbi:porin family protein [Colwellia sp. 75C3]|uniref:porin family protein n=1 Tax=Colwellia sp. 75C3 TaxID=888425 RepID=UPI0012FEE05D|nr:porin family protein [Colwellia sp. 75C3]